MATLTKLLTYLSKELEKKETDSEEFKKQSEKCENIYENLSLTLTAQQKELLHSLDLEHFIRAGIWKDEGYQEGLEAGFRSAVRLIFESL